MKNAIKYFYNFEPKEIINRNNYYFFVIDNEKYYLKVFDRNINDEKYLLELNKYMISNNILVHELISNKDNSLISYIDDIPYYLFKISINENVKVNLNEISYLSKLNVIYNKKLVRKDWFNLWSERIDYLENQINEIGRQHPILVDSFNYFVGMAENAISYIMDNNTLLKSSIYDNAALVHNKIKLNDSLLDLYDGVNFTIDHKSRDIAEYIKNSFFNKNNNIFNELNEYFKYNKYSEYGIRLLFARILYPSFYFDLYDDVINKLVDEKEILVLIKDIDNYEKYLKEIFSYLRMFYNIPEIEWLIKKRDINPR